MQFTSQDFLNNLAFFYSGENEGGGGFIGITEVHLEQYEGGDQRAELFYFDELSGTRRTAKWLQNGTQDGNVSIIRLAEMYLTRAESRFRMGDIAGATEDLNTIRQRAGLASLTESELTLEAILQERAIELAFEGHLFRDDAVHADPAPGLDPGDHIPEHRALAAAPDLRSMRLGGQVLD